MQLYKKLRLLLEPELDALFCRAVAETESYGEVLNLKGEATVTFNKAKFMALASNLPKKELNKIQRYTGSNQQTFKAAARVNSRYAVLASSWGVFQVPADCYYDLGYSSAYVFTEQMKNGLDAQVEAFRRLVRMKNLVPVINVHDVEVFTAAYNDDIETNEAYATKLRKNLKLFESKIKNSKNTTNKENNNG